MFINTARLLIRKRLVKQGETFDVFEITPAGTKAFDKAMVKTTITRDIDLRLKEEEPKPPASSEVKSSGKLPSKKAGSGKR
jgi:hypothetical protein